MNFVMIGNRNDNTNTANPNSKNSAKHLSNVNKFKISPEKLQLLV